MKSPILVILPESCQDPESDLRTMLERFRLNEDDEESIRNHHWDYWYYPETMINQPQVASKFSHLDPELAGNLGLIRDLDQEVIWSGVITPDFVWHDLADHGWRMVRHPCPENKVAEAAWKNACQEIIKRYSHHHAVGVIIHC